LTAFLPSREEAQAVERPELIERKPRFAGRFIFAQGLEVRIKVIGSEELIVEVQVICGMGPEFLQDMFDRPKREVSSLAELSDQLQELQVSAAVEARPSLRAPRAYETLALPEADHTQYDLGPAILEMSDHIPDGKIFLCSQGL